MIFEETYKRGGMLLQMRITAKDGEVTVSQFKGFANSLKFTDGEIDEIAYKVGTVVNTKDLSDETEIISLYVKTEMVKNGEEVEYSQQLKSSANRDVYDKDTCRILTHTLMKRVFLKAGIDEKQLEEEYFAAV